MKPVVIIVIIVVLFVTAGLIIRGVVSSTEKNLEKLKDLKINDIDLDSIKDGTYQGSYKSFPIAVELNVTVKDGRLEDVELKKHRSGQGGGADAIIGDVLENQSIEIDVVSGATYSSIVILKAVEEALLGADKK